MSNEFRGNPVNLLSAAGKQVMPEDNGYVLAEGIDTNTTPAYYLYFNIDGTYLIKRIETTASTIINKYFKGTGDHTANWTTNYAGLSYGYYHNVFNA